MAESIAGGVENRERAPSRGRDEGDAHYLCPQCRDINPLHLNARRARSASSLSARGDAEKKSTKGGKKGAEGGEGRRDTKSGFGSPRARESRRGTVVARAVVATCPGILGDKWRSSGSSSAFAWTRSNSTHRRFLLTVNKLGERSFRDRNNFAPRYHLLGWHATNVTILVREISSSRGISLTEIWKNEVYVGKFLTGKK